jgi:hypothetical protein
LSLQHGQSAHGRGQCVSQPCQPARTRARSLAVAAAPCRVHAQVPTRHSRWRWPDAAPSSGVLLLLFCCCPARPAAACLLAADECLPRPMVCVWERPRDDPGPARAATAVAQQMQDVALLLSADSARRDQGLQTTCIAVKIE